MAAPGVPFLTMTQFTLDYTGARPEPPRKNRWPDRRMRAAFRRVTIGLSALLCTTALVGLLRLEAENESLRTRYDRRQLQYDSLLAAKLEADRQLARLRDRLANAQGQP